MDTKDATGFFIVVLLVLAALSPMASAAEKVDLYFLIDGSSSLNPSDFELQKQGIADVINDSTLVPQDGSVSVCVIQFGTNVVVEVPLTTITSQTVADQISADIMSITFMYALNNMGGAFNTATANLPTDLSGRQVIDISTDGVPSTGPDAMTARNAAIAAGFDEVNTLGVGFYLDEAFLQSLVHPQPWEEPPGFYLYAANFSVFSEAIEEKIVRELQPTTSAVPALTPLGLFALAGMLAAVAVLGIGLKKR